MAALPQGYRVVRGSAQSPEVSRFHRSILNAHRVIFTENAARTFEQCNGVGKGNAPYWILIVWRAPGDAHTTDPEKVVGMATALEGFNPLTHAVAIYNVGVHPEHRRRGLGSVLYNLITSAYPEYKDIPIVDDNEEVSQRFTSIVCPGVQPIRRMRGASDRFTTSKESS